MPISPQSCTIVALLPFYHCVCRVVLVAPAKLLSLRRRRSSRRVEWPASTSCDHGFTRIAGARCPHTECWVRGERDAHQKAKTTPSQPDGGRRQRGGLMMPRGWPKPKVWRCELSFQGTEPYQGRIYRGEAPFEALDTKRERPQRLGNGCGRPRREKALSRGGLSAIWRPGGRLTML